MTDIQKNIRVIAEPDLMTVDRQKIVGAPKYMKSKKRLRLKKFTRAREGSSNCCQQWGEQTQNQPTLRHRLKQEWLLRKSSKHTKLRNFLS